MGFESSTYLQKLTDLILDIRPQRVPTLADDRDSTRLKPWDPFECSLSDVAAIRRALETVALEYVPEINTWMGAGKELANRLAGFGEDTISIGCDCVGNDYARSSTRTNPTGQIKYDLSICADRSHLGGAQRNDLIMFLVFRELVKLAGGNAVDYYSLWALFVLSDRTPPPRWGAPTPTWMDYMCAEGRALTGTWMGSTAGTFMVWSNQVGILYIGDKVNPTKGAQALTNGGFGLPSWQHACP